MSLNSIVFKNGFDINKNIDFKDKNYILWVLRAVKIKRLNFFHSKSKLEFWQ